MTEINFVSASLDSAGSKFVKIDLGCANTAVSGCSISTVSGLTIFVDSIPKNSTVVKTNYAISISVSINLNSKISYFEGFEFFKSDSDFAVSGSVCSVSKFSVSVCVDLDKSNSVVSFSDSNCYNSVNSDSICTILNSSLIKSGHSEIFAHHDNSTNFVSIGDDYAIV